MVRGALRACGFDPWGGGAADSVDAGGRLAPAPWTPGRAGRRMRDAVGDRALRGPQLDSVSPVSADLHETLVGDRRSELCNYVLRQQDRRLGQWLRQAIPGQRGTSIQPR